MAIVQTTLSGAITSSQTSFGVASATGITAPNYQTMTGITWLLVDQEWMSVETLAGTVVGVVRGKNGSVAQAHASGALVTAGAPGDFLDAQGNFSGGTFTTSKDYPFSLGSLNLPAIQLTGSADAINPSLPANYVIKTAGVDAMTIATPTVAQEGNYFYISSDTANAHTLTAASACFSNGTAATTVVTFKAFKGSNIVFVVRNLTYHVISSNVTSFA
jgi:hypothetical protein